MTIIYKHFQTKQVGINKANHNHRRRPALAHKVRDKTIMAHSMAITQENIFKPPSDWVCLRSCWAVCAYNCDYFLFIILNFGCSKEPSQWTFTLRQFFWEHSTYGLVVKQESQRYFLIACSYMEPWLVKCFCCSNLVFSPGLLCIALFWFFTSHQQSFGYIGTGLPGLNQY